MLHRAEGSPRVSSSAPSSGSPPLASGWPPSSRAGHKLRGTVTAKCFLLSPPDLGFLPVAPVLTVPLGPLASLARQGQRGHCQGDKGATWGEAASAPCPVPSLPVVPAELFRVPTHWPRKPMVATERHGQPAPSLRKARGRVDRSWLWSVFSVTETSRPGPPALVLSRPQSVPTFVCSLLPAA